MRPGAAALTRAGLIGAVSGLRSQWGVVAVAWTTPPAPGRPSPGGRRVRRWVRGATAAAAAAEFVADKSPSVPSRLSAGGLVPRLLCGALAGATLTGREPDAPPPHAAAAAAAVAALAFAFAGAGWRRAAGPVVGDDAVAAAGEDLVAVLLAWAACTVRFDDPPQAR